ncbi:cytochrome P450 [Hyaloraphidium curvatum]|nr:cytochrome P450 [Hyaloraphidium curvatum]
MVVAAWRNLPSTANVRPRFAPTGPHFGPRFIRETAREKSKGSQAQPRTLRLPDISRPPSSGSLHAMLSLFLSLLAGAFVLLAYLTRTRNPKVPGPPTWPIIGALPTFFEFIKRSRPGLGLAEIAKRHGPVARLTIPGGDGVIVSDPAIARRVLRGDGGKIVKGDETEHAMHDIAPKGLFVFADGPDWTRHRKRLQPAFGPVHLRNALGIASEIADKLYGIYDAKIGTKEAEAGFDFYSGLTSAVADVLGRMAFSYDFGNLEAMVDPSNPRETYNNLEKLLQVFSDRVFTVPRPFWNLAGLGSESVKPVTARVRAVVDEVIAARKKAREGGKERPEKEMDVLDRLMAQTADGEAAFTQDEIVDEVLAFYMAGQDAMANALVWFVYALSQNPAEQDKIHDEICRVVADHTGRPTYDELNELRYLDAAFRESLRLHTVLAQPAPRVVVQPTELGGYPIAPGTQVFVMVAAMHSDPSLWPDPGSYLPARHLADGKEEKDSSAYLPFSDGPHQCPGMRLAYLEGKAFVAPLVRRYRISLVPGQDLEPVEAVSTGLRKGLKLRLERR